MKYHLNFFKADLRHKIFAQATHDGTLCNLHDHLADSARPVSWYFFAKDDSDIEKELFIDSQTIATHQALEAILHLNVLRRGITRDFDEIRQLTSRGAVMLRLDGLLQYLDPERGRGASFLEFLMSFPRFEDGRRIILGGLPYLNAECCKTFDWPEEYADTMPPALRDLINGTPGNPIDAIADPAEKIRESRRLMRLMIDETVFTFKNYILSVAQVAGKEPVRAATRFTAHIDRLIGGLETLGINHFQKIDELLDKAIDGMAALREELAASTVESGNPEPSSGDILTELKVVREQQEKSQRGISFLVEDTKKRNERNKGRKFHRPRAKECSDEKLAALFNQEAVPLARKRDPETHKIILYENKRGGGGGVLYVGGCSQRTIRSWIKKYPSVQQAEPKSGFHADMLCDPEAVVRAAKRWGAYWRAYAEAFYGWRQIHRDAPYTQFRYKDHTVSHVENI